MKYIEYVEFSDKLEALAARHPRWYLIRVLAFASIGYLYILFLLVLALIFPALIGFSLMKDAVGTIQALSKGGVIWLFVLPVYLGFVGLILSALRSFSSDVPEPEGVEVMRADAPELFELISETTRSLKATMPQKVLINDQMNASVIPLSNAGIFGRRVTMSIGLLLMHSMSPEQFHAVIAHEIGHISARHGRNSKWVYAVNQMWGRLLDQSEAEGNKYDGLFKGFVKWYFPRLSAYSSVMNRNYEKHADLMSVEETSAKAAGEALFAMCVSEREAWEQFWRPFWEKAVDQSEPESGIFSAYLDSLRSRTGTLSDETISEMLNAKTDPRDTHPSLADRLKALGYWDGTGIPVRPAVPETTAAEYYLGDLVKKYAADFASAWDVSVANEWKTRHEYFRESKERLRSLESRPDADEMTAAEYREWAIRVFGIEGTDRAEEILSSGVERFPEDGDILREFGRYKLSKRDDAGVEIMERAVAFRPILAASVYSELFEYCHSQGRRDDAQRYADLEREAMELYEKALAERQDLTLSEVVIPHKLSDAKVAALREAIGTARNVKAAYLVAKQVAYFPEEPLHLVLIEPLPFELRERSQSNTNLHLELEGIFNKNSNDEFLFGLAEEAARLEQVKNVPNSLIYERDGNHG